MRVLERLQGRFRRFMQRPGTTVELGPFEELLPAVAERADGLAGLSDAELTAAARALRTGDRDPLATGTLVEACALAREAASRGLDQRPFDVQVVGALA